MYLRIREREVSVDKGAAFALSLGCPFVVTCGKQRLNVDLVFTNMIRALRVAASERESKHVRTTVIMKDGKKKKRCIIL
jgi:hypothetical protein